MTVVWSATVPETHRVGGTMRTELEQLEAHFVGLRASGEGYLEVELPTENSPQVTLSFRGDRAVVHHLADLDEDPKSFLLVGDGSLAPHGTVDVPVMDEDAVFSGDFVMTVDRAWEAVREFARTRSVAGLGEWCEL